MGRIVPEQDQGEGEHLVAEAVGGGPVGPHLERQAHLDVPGEQRRDLVRVRVRVRIRVRF